MAKLLFSLRNVPDDEAAEVRDLLALHNVDYYETPPGKWGISAPGLWLKQVDRYKEVKALLDTYHQLKQQGEHRTIVDAFKADPVRLVAYIVIIGVILYFSIVPFISLVKG